MEEKVILVDEHDNECGVEEKMKAHREGKLHRAFSIFIFNKQGELLLQQRAGNKYHTPQLWSNTCCSHPHEGESTEQAAHRRLQEEMGFDCPLKEAFTFIYKVDLGQGLIEHELDHVFIGRFDGVPVINPLEVIAWKYMHPSKLKDDIVQNPEHYTYWFREALGRVLLKQAVTF